MVNFFREAVGHEEYYAKDEVVSKEPMVVIHKTRSAWSPVKSMGALTCICLRTTFWLWQHDTQHVYHQSQPHIPRQDETYKDALGHSLEEATEEGTDPNQLKMRRDICHRPAQPNTGDYPLTHPGN